MHGVDESTPFYLIQFTSSAARLQLSPCICESYDKQSITKQQLRVFVQLLVELVGATQLLILQLLIT